MKLFLSLLLTVGLVGLANAFDYKVGAPRDQSGVVLQHTDYGGVSISTRSASDVGLTTATLSNGFGGPGGSGVFYGVQFASATAGSYEFVDVYDSSVTIGATNRLIARIYNVNGSTVNTVGGTNNAAASGFSGPKYPIRFNNGLIWTPGTSGTDIIMGVLFNQDVRPQK